MVVIFNNFLVYITYFVIYYPFVIIIHEFGHAIFIKIFGGKVNYIGFGEGDTWLEYKKFRIGKNDWLTGQINFDFENKVPTQKMILIYCGGSLINFISATLIWIFGNEEWANLYRGFIIYSYLIGIASLVPFKYNSGSKSDGLMILSLIKSIVRT
ncbi:site-2 protease family protein [Viridibacillus arvi]|uniref:Peptidase M50 domain-containing protein n=1 Tax=Viridibacillus arvi TaxID=263475 RepID=A0A0M0LCU3_9BACL|nr:site-2 protease family protein [Viridibacillus arvi]KOO48890.1 hypothetical protein AMD00_10765 [Viridibacillus arvi]